MLVSFCLNVVSLIILNIPSLNFKVFLDIKGNEKTDYVRVFPKIFKVDKDIYLVLGKYYSGINKGGIIVYKNGEEYFKKEFNASLYYGFDLNKNGVLIAGDEKGRIYAFDIFKKRIIWGYYSGYKVKEIHTKIINNQEYIVPVYETFGSVIFEVFKERRKIFSKEVKSFIGLTLPVIPEFYDNKVFFAEQNKFYSFDLKTKRIKMIIDTKNKMGAFLFVIPAPNLISDIEISDDVILVGTMFGDIFVVKNDKNTIEKISLGASNFITDLIMFDINNDNVKDILGSLKNGIIFAIDGKTHKTLFKFKTTYELYAAPLACDITGDKSVEIIHIDRNGFLYILTNKGKLIEKIKFNELFSNNDYLLAGDIDKDGKLEILLVGSTEGKLYIAETDKTVVPGTIIRGER